MTDYQTERRAAWIQGMAAKTPLGKKRPAPTKPTPFPSRIWERFNGKWWAVRKKESLKVALMLAGILALYGLVGRMDFEDELRREAARQEDHAALAVALNNCLNGETK
jgi:hypothetical protein